MFECFLPSVGAYWVFSSSEDILVSEASYHYWRAVVSNTFMSALLSKYLPRCHMTWPSCKIYKLHWIFSSCFIIVQLLPIIYNTWKTKWQQTNVNNTIHNIVTNITIDVNYLVFPIYSIQHILKIVNGPWLAV